MSTPTIRIPVTDRVDHRAEAYNRVLALADLTQHLDPALMVSLDVGAFGRLGVLLHNDATLTDATSLAVRLGLTDYTEKPSYGTELVPGDVVNHSWTGKHGACVTTLTWFERGSV